MLPMNAQSDQTTRYPAVPNSAVSASFVFDPLVHVCLAFLPQKILHPLYVLHPVRIPHLVEFFSAASSAVCCLCISVPVLLDAFAAVSVSV